MDHVDMSRLSGMGGNLQNNLCIGPNCKGLQWIAFVCHFLHCLSIFAIENKHVPKPNLYNSLHPLICAYLHPILKSLNMIWQSD